MLRFIVDDDMHFAFFMTKKLPNTDEVRRTVREQKLLTTKCVYGGFVSLQP
jgi:hypothetical protein